MEEFGERIFRDQLDLLGDGEWLMSRFRLLIVILDLCAVVGPVLQRSTRKNQAVPATLQVLATLGFLSTGTFQKRIV